MYLFQSTHSDYQSENHITGAKIENIFLVRYLVVEVFKIYKCTFFLAL